MEAITSYSAVSGSTSSSASSSGSAVVNQVVREYNDLGMLTKEYQEHGGAKGASTPYVQVNYDETAVSGELTKGMRLKSIRYPNGRLVHFTYGASGSDADYLNRLDATKADSGGSPGATLASYTYLGAGTVVEIDYEEPDVRLDLIGTGHAYSGFDRFGRLVDQKWYDYGASADRDRYKYGYDRASSRIWRENTTTTVKDEFYTYDGMHRLKNFDRGDLNGTKTGISGTPVREYDWNLDPTGNWETLLKKTSGVTDFNQSRDHSEANEIDGIDDAGGSSGSAADWVEPVHDRNGNMTTMPQPASPASSYTAKYDGWNRMVEVKAGPNTVADYGYDGLNRRISKTVSGTVRYFYYSLKWQVLEERVGASTSAESQHIFGPRYVDELVLRDRDSDSNGSLDERLYYLQDANFNITALVDTIGAAQERYVYEPYGEVDVFTGAWGSRGPSSYANRFMFTGIEYDDETGLMQFRRRYQHVQLGRWLNRDPLGYDGGHISLYEYGASSPASVLDPNGTFVVRCNCECTDFEGPPPHQWNEGITIVLPPSSNDATAACERACENRTRLKDDCYGQRWIDCDFSSWDVPGAPPDVISDFWDIYTGCSRSQCKTACLLTGALLARQCNKIQNPVLRADCLLAAASFTAGCMLGCARCDNP